MIARLSSRERLLVLGLLPMAMIIAVWVYAAQPLLDARDEALLDIADYRRITSAANQRPTFEEPSARASTQSLAARVTGSAEAFGLTLRRLEADGDGLRLVTGDADYSTVIDWISALEAEEGVIVRVAEIDRRPLPGTVVTRLELEAAK